MLKKSKTTRRIRQFIQLSEQLTNYYYVLIFDNFTSSLYFTKLRLILLKKQQSIRRQLKLFRKNQ